jgi:glyoxylase-like metal-dependent hydrolase (beta-lactamase superfamily II)
MMSQAAASSSEFRIEQIRDRLYVLRGGGRTIEAGGVRLPTAGNSLALVGDRGVLLVDTKLPGCGDPLLRALSRITDRPLTTIVNTHAHMDHVGANAELAVDASVEVIAHEATAEAMREMRPVGGGPAQPNPFREAGGRGLPTRTFRDRRTLETGGGAERIEIRHFGRAHTAGDAWVIFPALGVAHSGDAFAHKAVPVLDANAGGSGLEYPETLARAAAELSGVEVLVTGHHPGLLGSADLAQYREFVAEFVRAAREARRAGRPAEEFAAAWKLPQRFADAGYVSFEHLRPVRADVEAIWRELDGRGGTDAADFSEE